MARVPIALQLYSVREDASKDLAGTLAKVAKMGYEGVEFAGFYGHAAADVRKMLEDNGLKVAGSHTGWSLLQGDEFKKTVDYNLELGNTYLIVPSIPEPMRNSRAACLETAQKFNELVTKLKAYGLKTGFHNHRHEVQPFPAESGDKGNAFETLFDNTVPEFVMQIDVGHAMRGGGDPVALIRKYAGRAKTVHVKEYDPNDETTVVGKGVVPWSEVFAACEEVGGTEWYIVEHERYAAPPLVCVEECLKNLKAMGK